MKIVSVAALLVLLYFGAVAAQPVGVPVISKEAKDAQKPDPFTWDFGQVTQGEVAKHEFSLKNETSKVLNIKDVTTTCGCTGSEVKKKTLSPGEATVLEVKFNSKGYMGDVQRQIFVNTDNLDNPVLKFTIKAHVVTPLDIKTSEVKK